ncbi:MAG: hypothetical protein IT555_16490 [Acetobacteraceae bacterium]|nr:hypothetical protein [Acetobacteraceae bacterium]
MDVGIQMIVATYGWDEESRLARLAESSMRLFAKEVLPVLKSWQPVPQAAAVQ